MPTLTPEPAGEAIALRLRGREQVAREDWEGAARAFAAALRADPHDAPTVAAVLGLADLLSAAQRPLAALAAYDALLAVMAPSAKAAKGRAMALHALDRFDEAGPAFDAALSLDPGDADLRVQHGVHLHVTKRFEEAALAFRRAREIDPANAAAAAHLLNAKRRLCDWRDIEALTATVVANTRAELAAGAKPSAPLLGLLGAGAPFDLCMAVAGSLATDLGRTAGAGLAAQGYAPRTGKLRVGYLWPDFRGHSAGRLAATLIAAHDRDRVELFGYSLVPAAHRDADTERMAGLFAAFRDLTADDAVAAARRIHADGIHVLVDLAGYTRGARPEILAQRPAPVQCHTLGLNLPMAADWCPWLLADRVSYAEPGLLAVVPVRPAWLPGPWAAMARLTELAMTRAQAGLPDDALVIAAFAEPHKFDPPAWAAWMAVLRAVPGTVLWLLDAGDTVRRNLVRAAAGEGVAAGRLVWAPRLSNAEHRRRLACADLALDTWVQKSGATVLEFLAAGVPAAATRSPGPAFGAALVEAAGLPELVADDLADLTHRLTALLAQPGRLPELRLRLHAAPALPLFDPAAWAAAVEAAFETMWAEAAAAPR